MIKSLITSITFLYYIIPVSAQLSILDTTFGAGGHTVAPVGSTQKIVVPRMHVLSNGKILVREDRLISDAIWQMECWMHRFMPDGSIDTGFGNNGSVLLNPGDLKASYTVNTCLQVVTSGKILTGYRSANVNGLTTEIIRLNADGTPDQNFGLNGRVSFTDQTTAWTNVPIFNDLVARSDGKTVLIYNSRDNGTKDFGFRLLDINGIPMPGYDTIHWHHTAEEETFRKVFPISGNKFLIGGTVRPLGGDSSTVDMAVWQFGTDLEEDATFGNGGSIARDITGGFDVVCDMTLQKDNKIMICGIDWNSPAQRLWVSRFLPNGQADTDFGNNGHIIYYGQINTPSPNDYYAEGSLDIESFPDNRYIISGIAYRPGTVPFVYEPSFLRFKANGTPDTSLITNSARVFFPIAATGINYSMYKHKILPDQRILTCGESTFVPRTLSFAQFLPEPGATAWYRDLDNDDYGDDNVSIFAVSQPNGFSAAGGDCNDFNFFVHPGAPEVCNGIDDNCDGITDNYPTATCAEYVSVPLDETGNGTIHPGDVFIPGIDDCSLNITQISLDTTQYDCADLGFHTVTLTVTNDSGYSNTCITSVDVVDKIKPQALCLPQLAITLDNTGMYSLTGIQLDNGSTDNCGIITYTSSKGILTTNDIGTTTVSLTVFDASGNTSSCQTVLTVNASSSTLESETNLAGLTIFPNPASDQTTISWQAGKMIQPTQLILIDPTGRAIRYLIITDNQYFIQLNIAELPSGQYQIGCKYANGQSSTKQFTKL